MGTGLLLGVLRVEEIVKVKNWFAHYTAWKGFIRNTAILIQNLKAEMELEAAPAGVRYDLVPGGGGGKHDSTEERNLERKEQIQAKITQLEQRARTARNRITIMDSTMEALHPLEKELLQYRDIEGLKWAAVALRIGVNEKTARVAHQKALEKVAITIFGIDLDT